jgi:hypothetical protein
LVVTNFLITLIFFPFLEIIFFNQTKQLYSKKLSKPKTTIVRTKKYFLFFRFLLILSYCYFSGEQTPIGFQTLLRTKYVPSLVKIHWRILILECSQGCYTVKMWTGDLDLWPWKSIGFQILLRTKYVPSLRINILQWILTKLSTYLEHRRVWNPIDFQGQRSRSLG